MIACIDGASHGNPGPSGIGVAIYDENKKLLRAFGYYLGKLTNNMAEYMAAGMAMISALELGARSLTIYSDSELLVRQMCGEYRIKNEKLLPLYLQVKFFTKSFKTVAFHHVGREENVLADRLANRAIAVKGFISP